MTSEPTGRRQRAEARTDGQGPTEQVHVDPRLGITQSSLCQDDGRSISHPHVLLTVYLRQRKLTESSSFSEKKVALKRTATDGSVMMQMVTSTLRHTLSHQSRALHTENFTSFSQIL